MERINNVDILILNDILIGEIEKKEFIKLIRFKNSSMKIIIILEQKDEQYENFLISNGIFDFFYNGNVEVEEVVQAINLPHKTIIKYEIPKELIEEMNFVKSKIYEKNKIKIRLRRIMNKLKKINTNMREQNIFLDGNNHKKILTIIGNSNKEKQSFVTSLATVLRKVYKYNILTITLDKERVNENLTVQIIYEENILYQNMIEKFKNYVNKTASEYDLVVFDVNEDENIHLKKELIKMSDKNIFIMNIFNN